MIVFLPLIDRPRNMRRRAGGDGNFTSAERSEINRIGNERGCNTFGTREPGTKRGNWVIDHYDPGALVRNSRPQRLFPQCIACSDRQGGAVFSLKRRR